MLKPVHCGWHHSLGWEPSSIERKKQSECSHLSFSYVSLKMQCFLSLPSLCTFYHNAKQIQTLSSSKPFIINFLFSDYFYDVNICNKKMLRFWKENGGRVDLGVRGITGELEGLEERKPIGMYCMREEPNLNFKN